MSISSFAECGLAAPLLEALSRLGLTRPTPIQAMAVPVQLGGRDILGVARTGSGKTAAFCLPILHSLLASDAPVPRRRCRALVLSPTRELAEQIEATLVQLASGTSISFLAVLGGRSRALQISALEKGVDVVIATPGRLSDLLEAGAIELGETCMLVLDEADQMLDLGFLDTVRQIVAGTHPARRTAMFSATMPPGVINFARGFLSSPVHVEPPQDVAGVADIIEVVELMPLGAKLARLSAILRGPDVVRALVFARTRRGADELAEGLKTLGLVVEVIHGDKTPNVRQRTLARFRAGLARVLVATDLVARGIDVAGVTHVVNYDLPDSAESYVHRIGRTGRNGASGMAFTLCSPGEIRKLKMVEKFTGRTLLDPALIPPKRERRRSDKGGRGRR